jgi:parallel beta-helix repeat protein
MRRFILLIMIIIITNFFIVGAYSKELIIDPTSKIFYVDDDAPIDWYDKTHFKTIMDAINYTVDRDIVFVYNGTYYEKISINKSIHLIGENKLNTIIDGRFIKPEISIFGTSIVRINYTTSQVILSGFTIQNVFIDTLSVDAGIYIEGSDCNIISNNIIRNITNTGIEILSSHNNIISDNEIINVSDGVSIVYTDSTILIGNVMRNINYKSLLIWKSDNNIILENNITDSRQGIVILESCRNLIKRNNIANNTEGVFLSLSRRNKFYENNFIDSGFAGHVEFKGWSFLNRWRGNYWDNQLKHGLPKILLGRFGILPIPWFDFDWRPAKVPYDIS